MNTGRYIGVSGALCALGLAASSAAWPTGSATGLHGIRARDGGPSRVLLEEIPPDLGFLMDFWRSASTQADGDIAVDMTAEMAERLIAARPSDAAAMLNFAGHQILFEKAPGGPERARALFTRASEIAPGTAQGASALRMLGDLAPIGEALPIRDLEIATIEGLAEAHERKLFEQNLLSARIKTVHDCHVLGRLDDAIDRLAFLIEHTSREVWAEYGHMNLRHERAGHIVFLGTLLLKAGRGPEALARFDQALRDEPTYGDDGSVVFVHSQRVQAMGFERGSPERIERLLAIVMDPELGAYVPERFFVAMKASGELWDVNQREALTVLTQFEPLGWSAMQMALSERQAAMGLDELYRDLFNRAIYACERDPALRGELARWYRLGATRFAGTKFGEDLERRLNEMQKGG